MTTVKVSTKGQIVIPRDIRQMLGLHSGEQVVFEVINVNDVRIKKEESIEEFLDEFFTIARSKKSITLKELKEPLKINKIKKTPILFKKI